VLTAFMVSNPFSPAIQHAISARALPRAAETVVRLLYISLYFVPVLFGTSLAPVSIYPYILPLLRPATVQPHAVTGLFGLFAVLKLS
jgi:hypothetical protein